MSTPFRTYAEFEAAVIDPIEAHRREHLSRYWHEASAAVRALLDSLPGPSIPSADVLTTVTGWLYPIGPYRLSARRLQRLNPGYSVRILRSPRREVGRIASVLRAGFRVEAGWIGTGERPPFTFAVLDRRGGFVDLPASNADAEFRKQFFRAQAVRTGVTPAPLGYIDQVRDVPLAVDTRPETWLAELVHVHPQHLRDLIESTDGRWFAPEAARLAATFAENARWGDKFTLSAFGLDGEYRSDLLPLRVVVPNPTGAAKADGFPVPEPQVEGSIVRYHPGPKRLAVPSEQWLSLSDVTVEDGGTVRSATELIVYESSAHPASDFVSGQYTTVFGSRTHRDAVLVQPRPDAGEVIPEAILLSGRNDFNWFHWLVEYLPRVLLAGDRFAPTVPLLVTPLTPSTGRQALATLTSRPVIEMDRALSHRVGVLHVVAPPVQVLDTTGVPWSEGLSLNASALNAMRAAIGVPRRERPTQRVFLERSSGHRGLVNEAELAAIARTRGLDVINPGELDFAHQVELFSGAELVVGASGAVMANYLMMSPGSRIVALTSQPLFDFVLPAALAAVAGAEFCYITGEPTRTVSESDDRNQWLVQSDYSVDAVEFAHCLDASIAALDATKR